MLIKIEKLPSGTKSQTDIANNQVSNLEKNKKRCTNGQYVHKEMISFIHHQGNAKWHCYDVIPTS